MAKKKTKKALNKHEREYLLTLKLKDPATLTDAERNTISNFSKDRRNKSKKNNENKNEYLSELMQSNLTITNNKLTVSTDHSQKKIKKNKKRRVLR